MNEGLNNAELASPAWHKCEAYANHRIARLTSELKQDKDLVATAKVRGRIAEIEAFLRVMKVTRESVVDAG